MEFPRLRSIVFFILYLFSTTDSLGIRRYESELYENDFCGLDPSVYSGKCKKIKKCVSLLVEKKDIEICAFNGIAADETLVCCSRKDFYKSRTMIGEGPLDYQTCLKQYKHLRPVVSDQEELSHFTVNGVDVKDGEFPHMAAIGWMKWDSFTIEWHCGGSLISESHVLTAAHCTSVAGRKPNIIRLGDNDLNSSDDDQNVQEFDISGIIKHPYYNPSTSENDIAIIQMRESVVPTPHVVPACIVGEDSATEYFEAAGFGQDGVGMQTNRLSKVFLKFMPLEKCQESYEGVTLSDSQLCAKSYREDLLEQDTCYGDSGSPLQYMNNNFSADGHTYRVPTIVGLTSFGIGCAFGHPSVYVKVSKYIEWMETVIKP